MVRNRLAFPPNPGPTRKPLAKALAIASATILIFWIVILPTLEQLLRGDVRPVGLRCGAIIVAIEISVTMLYNFPCRSIMQRGIRGATGRAMLRAMRRVLTTAVAIVGAACAALAQEVHYSPEESLDAIDAKLIEASKVSIDLASYSLTDATVIDALNAAARRGVVIRIVLDPRERHDFAKLGDLSDNVRIKRGGPFMHLKAYEVDGTFLRTGSANFSASGEGAQDNDLVVIRDASAATKFEAHFERMWDAAEPMDEFAPAINALEPK